MWNMWNYFTSIMKIHCTSLGEYIAIWQRVSAKALKTRAKCAVGQCHVKTVCSVCLKTAIIRQTMWGSCVKWFQWIRWAWQSQVQNINAVTVYIGLCRWMYWWNPRLTWNNKRKHRIALELVYTRIIKIQWIQKFGLKSKQDGQPLNHQLSI